MKIIQLAFIIVYITGITYSQTVKTQYGNVTGNLNGTVYEFLGIPFAAPPVDSLRWKPTRSPEEWSNPILTRSFPPKCPQKKYDLGDDSSFTIYNNEDCLYLNVWSPDTAANLPVMVFIHGGGNQQGSTSEISGGTEIYHGKNLSERGNVVVVTIQYRLGVLGYLVHPGLDAESRTGSSGNFGVLDQIFALQWVQNNISNFGGDPAKVTIFGESGGGINVGNLLTTSKAEGLFHRAVIQSATTVLSDYDTAMEEGIEYVNEFTSDGTDEEKIDSMRNIHVDTFIVRMEPPLSGGIVQSAWGPVIDNYIFNDNPQDVFRSGNFNNVPLIIGSNKDEMLPQTPATVYPFMVSSLLKTVVPDEYLDTAYSLYPPGDTTTVAKQSYADILTDGQFTAATRRTARCVSLNQEEPVWRYFLTHSHNEEIQLLSNWGAYHGIDLFYIFNTWENSPLAAGRLFTGKDDSVQYNMMKYWTNFAYSGNPNGIGLIEWPQYEADKDCYLEIKANPDGSQYGLRRSKSDFWDMIGGFEGCSPTSVMNEKITPDEFALYQNYPNPFNSQTTINFVLPEREFVKLEIFNILGELVDIKINKSMPSGKHSYKLNAGNYTSGVYFYRLNAGKFIITGKMILLR